MAYRPWTTPSGLLSGRRGGGSYSMAGPGNRSASISALQAISNPSSAASIARPVIPSSELPFSTQPSTEPMDTATRAEGIKRYKAPVVGEKEPSGIVQNMQGVPMMPSMGTTLTGVPLPSLPGMPGSPGMPGPAGMPGGLPGTTPYGGSSGPIVPPEIKGNLPAIADWKKSGLPFSQWIQTVGASPWF